MVRGRQIIAVTVLLVLCLAVSQAAHARRNVLLVFDEDNDLPGLALINRSLRQVLRSELKDDVEFYSESLNASQFRDPGYHGVLREHFRNKYRDKRPDLIIAVMEPSLDFMVQNGEAVFPGVPIVFCGADPSDVGRRTLRPNITGVLVERDFAPTLQIALDLQPQTRNVFMVGGSSRFDRQIQAIAKRNLQPFETRVAITWLTALPMGELLQKLPTLPAHSVIYYLTVFADGAGSAFGPHEALSRIAAVANAPIYASVDQYIGLGAVGGSVYSVATHGEQAAQIGVRILRGEAPSAIPVVALAAAVNVFDWRQLQRWGLDEARLPPGSAVEFRSPSIWQEYRGTIALGLTLFLLQSALMVALLVNRMQRRRAESDRAESDRRRRHAEEEAARQRGELAHALRVTTIGELAMSIAHEINQPLTAIVANAEAARRLLASNPADPEVREALAEMASEANRAGETVHRLRALFRKQPAANDSLDVNALIDDVLRLLAPDLRSKEISVRFLRGERLPPVLGDGVQLRQVVINLLVNAEEAIGPAGDAPREIRILTGLDEAQVMIEISDSGIGVKESDLKLIFEQFVSTKPQGLGLGLAISRSIVEAHGGRIWATRHERRGLTLHLRLPARAAASQPRKAPASSETAD